MAEKMETPRVDAAECEFTPSADPFYEGPYTWVEASVARQLERELQAVRKDAQRYRWLCSMAWGVQIKDGWHELQFRTFPIEKWPSAMSGKSGVEITKQVADTAIDAALTEQGNGTREDQGRG